MRPPSRSNGGSSLCRGSGAPPHAPKSGSDRDLRPFRAARRSAAVRTFLIAESVTTRASRRSTATRLPPVGQDVRGDRRRGRRGLGRRARRAPRRRGAGRLRLGAPGDALCRRAPGCLRGRDARRCVAAPECRHRARRRRGRTGRRWVSRRRAEPRSAALRSAAGGETLASANIVRLAGPVAGVVVGDLVERMLKGFDRPVEAAVIGAVHRWGCGSGGGCAGRCGAGARGSSARERCRRSSSRSCRSSDGRRNCAGCGGTGVGLDTATADGRPVRTAGHRQDPAVGRSCDARPAGRGMGQLPPGAEKTEPTGLFAEPLGPLGRARHGGRLDADRRVASRLWPTLHRTWTAARAPAGHPSAGGASALLAMIGGSHRPNVAWELGHCSPDEVRSMWSSTGMRAEQAPIRQLWDDSRGVPAAAHRAAAVWAPICCVAAARGCRSPHRDRSARPAVRAGRAHRGCRSARADQRADTSLRADGRTAAGLTICPYKGLASFDVDDAE